MMAVIVIWGTFAFAIPPVMQAAVIAAAKATASGAVGTASGFTVAAFNLGITIGSLIGGMLLAGPGLLATPYAAMLMAGAALFLVGVAVRGERRTVGDLPAVANP